MKMIIYYKNGDMDYLLADWVGVQKEKGVINYSIIHTPANESGTIKFGGNVDIIVLDGRRIYENDAPIY